MKVLNLYRVITTGVLAWTLSANGQQGSNDNGEQRVQSILSLMTLDEKLSYISGAIVNFASLKGVFNIKPIPRLGLPEIFGNDGTIGILGQASRPARVTRPGHFWHPPGTLIAQ